MGEVKSQCDLKYKGGKCGQHPRGLMYEDIYIYIACCIEKKLKQIVLCSTTNKDYLPISQMGQRSNHTLS